jgi:hypothetical protein
MRVTSSTQFFNLQDRQGFCDVGHDQLSLFFLRFRGGCRISFEDSEGVTGLSGVQSAEPGLITFGRAIGEGGGMVAEMRSQRCSL